MNPRLQKYAEAAQASAAPGKLSDYLRDLGSKAAQLLKDNPHLATVPLGAAAGGYLANQLGDGSALSTALGAAGGATVGGVLGSAMTTSPRAFAPEPPKERERGAINNARNTVHEYTTDLPGKLISAYPKSALVVGAASVPAAGYALRKNITFAPTSALTLKKAFTGDPGFWDPVGRAAGSGLTRVGRWGQAHPRRALIAALVAIAGTVSHNYDRR